MSVEQLLLIAFLIGIPLLERLVRVLRERTIRSQADVATSALPERPPPVPQHAAPERVVSRVGTRARGESLRRPALPVPVEGSPQRVRRGSVLRQIRAAGNLRRGIVLMTMLGPCRAIDPYDWPEARTEETSRTS